jgi:hypothetical protein
MGIQSAGRWEEQQGEPYQCFMPLLFPESCSDKISTSCYFCQLPPTQMTIFKAFAGDGVDLDILLM